MDASGPVMPLGPLPSYGHCHHPAFRGPSPCVPSSAEIGHHGLPGWPASRAPPVRPGGGGGGRWSWGARAAVRTRTKAVLGKRRRLGGKAWPDPGTPSAPLELLCPGKGSAPWTCSYGSTAGNSCPDASLFPRAARAGGPQGRAQAGGVTSLLLRRQARRPTPRATVPGSLCKGQNERRARRSLQACSSFKGKRRFEQGVHQQHSHNQV